MNDEWAGGEEEPEGDAMALAAAMREAADGAGRLGAVAGRAQAWAASVARRWVGDGAVDGLTADDYAAEAVARLAAWWPSLEERHWDEGRGAIDLVSGARKWVSTVARRCVIDGGRRERFRARADGADGEDAIDRFTARGLLLEEGHEEVVIDRLDAAAAVARLKAAIDDDSWWMMRERSTGRTLGAMAADRGVTRSAMRSRWFRARSEAIALLEGGAA